MIRPLAVLLPAGGLAVGLAVGVANSAPVLALCLGGSVLVLAVGAVGGHWLDVWLKRRNEAYRDALAAGLQRDLINARLDVLRMDARQGRAIEATYYVEGRHR